MLQGNCRNGCSYSHSSTSSAQSRHQLYGVSAPDCLEIGSRKPELLQSFYLVKTEIWIIRTVRHLCGGHELQQRRHGGRTGCISGVVVEPSKLSHNALRSKLFEVRPLA